MNTQKLESNLVEVNALEPWPEPVDGGLLLDDLRRTLTRFVVLPQWGAEALALWTLHTYAFELREVSAYVGIESPEKRCGKTTLVAALSELVNRPEVAANISPPAFFRVIEETRPTLLIDEADTLLPGNDALRGILNSGYKRRTSYVVRVNSQGSRAEGPMGLARFSCWCPKLVSTIGSLPETLADRCIVVRMHRKTASERCERLRDLNGERLRRCCLRFVADRAAEIAGARAEIPAGLNDRAGDIWEPLLVLADLAGGEWPKWAREAAVGLSGGSQENGPIGSLLLDMVVAVCNDGGGADVQPGDGGEVGGDGQPSLERTQEGAGDFGGLAGGSPGVTGGWTGGLTGGVTGGVGGGWAAPDLSALAFVAVSRYVS